MFIYMKESMTKENREYIAFMRRMSYIFFWTLGVVPLALVFLFDVVLLAPYMMIVSIVVGIVIYIHVRALSRRIGEINDR